MNEETHNSTIEPDLEARIVALVLGEASDFETEELNRLIALRPELAAFMQEMRQVHELLASVALNSRRALAPVADTNDAGETSEASVFRLMETPDANWKLSTERRNAVLAVIKGDAIANENGAALAGVGMDATAPDPASGVHNAFAPAEVQSIPWCKSPQAPGAGPGENGSTVGSGLNAASTGLARRLRTMLSDSLGPLASSVRRRMRKTPMKIAAGICAAGFIGLMTVPWFVREEAMVANRSNEWAFTEDSVASTEHVRGTSSMLYSHTNRHSLFLTDPASGLKAADGEVQEQLIAKLDSANVDSAAASTRALSTLQQTLNGGGLAANEADHDYPSRGREAVPPSSAPEGWFAKSRDERVTTTEPSTTWEDKSLSGLVDRNAPATDGTGVRPDVLYRAPLLAGTIDRPASPEPIAVGSAMDESMPKLMVTPRLIIPTEEESASKSLSLAVTDSEKALEDQQASMGAHPFAGNPIPDGYAATDKSGYAADGKSDGEQLGKELQKNEALGLSGGESDFGTMAKGLSERSDESGVARRWSVPAQPGSGGRPGQPATELSFGRPGDARDAAKDGTVNFDAPVSERLSESDGKKSGEYAKQIEEQAQVKNPGEGRGVNLYLGHRFDMDLLDGLQPLAESRSKAAAQPESDSDEKGIRDSVSADEEMAPAKTSLGQAGKKNSPRTDAGQLLVQNGEQEGAQPNSEAKPAESLSRLGIFSGMQGNPPSKNPPQIDAEQWRRLEMLKLEKQKAQLEAGLPEVQERRKGIEEGLEEKINRLSRRMRESQASEAMTVAPERQLMQIVRPELQTRKLNLPSAGLNETNAAVEAFSTFSLHVSDVSFKLAASALARGEWPEAAKVRIEEFVNAFDYGDPLPGKGEKVACVVEQGIHPFLQQRNVLRVSMRTSAEGRATNTPLRLTFVLDNSGSMERIDRQQTVRRAFTLLSKQLTAIDQVTLISFSRQPRLLAENVSGAESAKLIELMEQLPSEGGTNIEAAMQLAFEKASAQQTPGAQIRIVLLTDGAVNLGNANPEGLSQMVESMRAAGIAFDAAGISADGLNDEVLEALTRKGDGRYYLMDSGEAADDNFAQQIAGALRPSASNVKVQVEFNPKRVGQYKLLGFEKHLLKQEDFRNDAVDAAEMAAAEAGVALYQFEAKPDGEGDVGSVSVRFKDLATGQMVEHRWPIPYEPNAARLEESAVSLRIATSAAFLAAKLKGEALGETVDLQTLSQLIDGLPSPIQSHTRIQQLKLMIEQARQLGEK